LSKVAVFHHISDEKKDFHNTLEEILNYDGIVTFDGAYESVFGVRRQLEAKNPILFVSGNQIGRESFCNMLQLEQLKREGWVIGWHGWSHRKLVELSDKEINYELRCPEFFARLYAYPHGDWDGRVAKIVKDMGYLRAYSTTQGEQDNDFAIPREYI